MNEKEKQCFFLYRDILTKKKLDCATLTHFRQQLAKCAQVDAQKMIAIDSRSKKDKNLEFYDEIVATYCFCAGIHYKNMEIVNATKSYLTCRDLAAKRTKLTGNF